MHSFISPSTAGIWGPAEGCRAFPFVAARFPRAEGEDDRRGTAAHHLGAEMIRAHIGVGAFPLPDKIIGQPAPNGVIYDRDIYDSAQIYASDVVLVLKENKEAIKDGLFIEQRVNCPSIHPDSFGTPDVVFMTPHAREIYIWDFKNGHVSVDPFENWQCINYLSGILDAYQIDGLLDQQTYITITIVQPNAYDGGGPIKRWKCIASTLRPYFNYLKQSAEEVFEQAGEKTRSGAHCRFCPGRFGCVSAIRAGLSLYESRDVTCIAEDVTSVATHYAIITEAYDRLKAIKKGLETQVESLLRSGQQVAGVHLDKSLSRSREWVIPESDLLEVAKEQGINLKKEVIATPKEAEELGLSKSVVDALSERRETGFTVKKDNINEVRKIFYHGSN